MAHATAHIDQQNILIANSWHVDQARHVVETDIHPARAALVVGGHVIVELGGGFGVLFEELEEVEWGVEAKLEGTVSAIGGVLVVGSLQLGGEGEDTGCDAGGPGGGGSCWHVFIRYWEWPIVTHMHG